MTGFDDTGSESESLTPDESFENTTDDAPTTQSRCKSLMRDIDDALNGFPVAPDERLLRVLAANPEKPRTQEDFVTHTNFDSNTITDTLERLETQGLVDDRGGRYFIPESRQSTVNGLLSDTRQLRSFASESTQGRGIAELDPQSADAHILTLIYINTSRSYSVEEIHTDLDDALDFDRDTIEETVSRLYEANRIQKTANGRYQAIEGREVLRRFAGSMKSAKRMFRRYSD